MFSDVLGCGKSSGTINFNVVGFYQVLKWGHILGREGTLVPRSN